MEQFGQKYVNANKNNGILSTIHKTLNHFKSL